MRPHKVEFFFDYNSPYSYIASLQVEALCERQGATLEWHPMVLGAIFQAMGHTPGFLNETRRKYMMEDLRNLTEMYGLPYRERTQFIFHPILSMRATVQVPQGAQRGKAVHALFRGAFAEDKDLGQPEVVAELLNQAGLNGKALVEGANQQAVKDTLKANTDRAMARGVFGAPTLFIDESRMFWGHDRLHVVEHFLQQP